MDTAVVVALVLSSLSLVVSLVEVFKDEIGQRVGGEYLRLEFDEDPALCQLTQHDAFVEGYHDCVVVRLRVTNTGKRPATGVRLLLAGLETATENSQWVADRQFCPIHLTWIHTDPAHLLPQIPPRTNYFVNLGLLLPPNVTPSDANRVYEPERFPSKRSTFQLLTQKNPMNNASFLVPNFAYSFRYQLLTDRGLRGAGLIQLSFQEQADLSISPNRLLNVEVVRQPRVAGRRVFQRDL